MPNPYHDAAGRFASRDELTVKIEAAHSAGQWDIYYAERANLEQIEADIAKSRDIQVWESNPRSPQEATHPFYIVNGGMAASLRYPPQYASSSADTLEEATAKLEEGEAVFGADGSLMAEDPKLTAQKAQYRRSFGEISEYVEDSLIDFEERVEKGADQLQKMADESDYGSGSRLQGKAIALRSSLASWKMIVSSPTTTSVNIAAEKFNASMDDMVKETQTSTANETLNEGEIEGYKLAQSYVRSIQLAAVREAQHLN